MLTLGWLDCWRPIITKPLSAVFRHLCSSLCVSLNVSPCLARAYSSVCLCVQVCLCSPMPSARSRCKCASADKEPAGIQRSANTVCTTLNTEHTLHKHCTIVQYSTEHKDNPKTALLCFNCYNTRTLHASHCGCCKHKMHCRDLAHCTVCIGALAKQHLHTAHWITKEHIAHIMCSTAFYRHISWVLIASMPWQYNLPLVLSAIFSFLF